MDQYSQLGFHFVFKSPYLFGICAPSVGDTEFSELLFRDESVETGVDGVEHFGEQGVLQISPYTMAQFSKLLLGDFALVSLISHSEEVAEDQSHTFEASGDSFDRIR